MSIKVGGSQIYINSHTHTHTHTHTYIYIHTHTHTHTYIYIYIYIYIYKCIVDSVLEFSCQLMYVCMYVSTLG
jgi:hypothetical protein